MHEALHDPVSRDEAFAIVRSLIDQIRLIPVDGELRIEIKASPPAPEGARRAQQLRLFPRPRDDTRSLPQH
jgi:hypothetical protein